VSRRDVREPFVVHTHKDGFTIHSFPVTAASMNSRVGMGHYVMVPVLNEQAGDEMVAELKRRTSQPNREQQV
jgi:hypothetical protein